MEFVDAFLREEKVTHMKINLATQLASLNFLGYAFYLPKYVLMYLRQKNIPFLNCYPIDKLEHTNDAGKLFSMW